MSLHMSFHSLLKVHDCSQLQTLRSTHQITPSFVRISHRVYETFYLEDLDAGMMTFHHLHQKSQNRLNCFQRNQKRWGKYDYKFSSKVQFLRSWLLPVPNPPPPPPVADKPTLQFVCILWDETCFACGPFGPCPNGLTSCSCVYKVVVCGLKK